jgi:Acetyltransferase (GNAT) family
LLPWVRRAAGFDLIAEDEESGRVAGWLSVEVLQFRRARHTGYLVTGVDTAAAGRGIGRDLLAAAGREASGRRLHRLELTVMTDNLRALGLYLRSGFRVEGLRHHTLLRDATRPTSTTSESSCPSTTGPDLDRLGIAWLNHHAARRRRPKSRACFGSLSVMAPATACPLWRRPPRDAQPLARPCGPATGCR